MNYTNDTEGAIHARTIEAIWTILDIRLGCADAERSCSRPNDCADIKRETQANYKDFWTRFARCVDRIQALGIHMGDSAVFNKASGALRIPEGKLPVGHSALETRQGPERTTAIREMATRAYESRRRTDASEVYQTQTHNPPEIGPGGEDGKGLNFRG